MSASCLVSDALFFGGFKGGNIFPQLNDYLFNEVGVNRIQARHDTDNPNSGIVMQKCGMKYEGTMRKSDRTNNGICDIAYYAILAEEYKK